MTDCLSESAHQRPFPSLAQPAPGWAGLPIALERLPSMAEVSDVTLPHAAVAVVLQGHGRRWLQIDGQRRAYHSAPGMLEVLSANTQIERAAWAGQEGQVIGLELPAPLLEGWLHEDARHLQWGRQHEWFDRPLAKLLALLWQEAREGGAAGPLYAQGLSLAILGRLNMRCVPGAPAPRTNGKWSDREMAQLRDWIHDQLAGELRIETLAGWMAMSPDHFARVFKASFGVTPHAYVLQRRIEAAARALRHDRQRPIAMIAGDFGFSSQSHFSQAFRRLRGTTPANWRRR